MLVDIVSKNGNLLLNIPVRGDGSIDNKEIAILEEIAAWMEVNKESIFGTRPWKIYGEGPSVEAVNALNGPGFNEGNVGFTGKDIRFNQKGNVLYATILGVPEGQIILKSLGKTSPASTIRKIEVLGSSEKLSWKQQTDSLVINPIQNIPNKMAVVLKILMD